MRWLREHGLISSYDDYLALPAAVLGDAQLLMEAEAVDAKRRREAASARGG
jgi:hypothetical protein